MSEIAELELWCNPDVNHEFFSRFNITRRLQQGADLGERMCHAFDVTEGPAILIGTDCPELDANYLKLALQQLSSNDAVIGPAEDGGYGLIGLRQANPDVFTGIRWGSDVVLSETCRVLNRQDHYWSLLPLLWDVDRAEDHDRYLAFTKQL